MFPWLVVASLLSAAPGIISSFEKKPDMPSAEELSGAMTPEQQAQFMEMLDRRLTKTASTDIAKVRQDAANRGAFRSGQLPVLETDILGRKQEALASAELQIAMQRTQGLAGARKSLMEMEWGDYGARQEAAGAGMGAGFSNFLRLLELRYPIKPAKE